MIDDEENGEDYQSVDLLSINGNDKMGDDDDDDETVDPAFTSASVAMAQSDTHTAASQPRGESRSSAGLRSPPVPGYSVTKPQHARSTAATATSPATQTLDELALSQESVDMHYDFSQLEYDVVAALVKTKKTRVDPHDNGDDSDEDDPMESRSSNAMSPLNKVKAKMRAASSLSAATIASTAIGSRPRAGAARDQMIPSGQTSKTASKASARSTIVSGTQKAAVSSRASQHPSRASATAGAARGRLLPVRTSVALPTSTVADVNGKRGRLPESDRRDILQISVATGLPVRKFTSFSEAGKAVGFSRHIVSSILRGTYKTNQYKGWTFRFVDDENNENQSTKIGKKRARDDDEDSIPNVTGEEEDVGASLDEERWSSKTESKNDTKSDTANPPRRKQYNCIEHIEVASGNVIGSYPSYVAAAEHSGVSRQKISAMVRGELDAFNGSTFRHDTDKVSAHPQPSKRDSASQNSRQRSVRGTLNSSTPLMDRLPVEPRDASTTSSRVRTSKAAIAVEELDASTGKVLHVHRSLTLASEHSGANRHVISNVLKGKLESWKGKIWRYSTAVEEEDVLEAVNESDDKRTDIDASRGRGKRQAQTEEFAVVATSSTTGQPGDTTGELVLVKEERDSKKMRRVSHDNGTHQTSSATAAVNLVGGDNRQEETMTTNPPRESVESEFVTRNVMLEQTGHSLGITVTKVKAPGSLFTSLQASHCVEKGDVQVFVESMATPSLASTAGIQCSDYILFPKEDPVTSRTILHADYNVVVEAIKGEKRPCTFVVARLKSLSSTMPFESLRTTAGDSPSTTDGGPTGSTPGNTSSGKDGASRSPPNNDGTKHSGGNAKRVSVAAGWQGDEKDEAVAESNMAKESTSEALVVASDEKQSIAANEPSVASFCLLCMGTPKTRVHHAWCPKNPQHESSGADDVLKAIRAGIQLGCTLCEQEYECGRRKDKRKHLKGCPRRQPVVPASSTVTKKTAKERKPDVEISGAQLSHEVTSICDDGDDDSAYASQSNNVGPCKKLTLLKPKGNGNNRTGNAKSLHGGKPPKKGSTMMSGLALKSVVALKGKSTAASLNPTAAIEEDDFDTWDDEWESNEKLTVVWEDCTNPWGRDGHKDDDVVVFSSVPGFGHPETLFTAERYEEYPFSSRRRYRQTHVPPEKGYQAIVLRRDALAQRPWGFTSHYHEFGGACLVHSVDPLSPAFAATLLGNAPDDKIAAPLCENDMILAVDGRFIGGMTTVGVEIALEEAGPEVVLLVSRYLFATEHTNHAMIAENSYIKHVDALVNDERMLGWIDLCGGNDTNEPRTTVALASRNNEDSNTSTALAVSMPGPIVRPLPEIPHYPASPSTSANKTGEKSDIPNEVFTEQDQESLRPVVTIAHDGLKLCAEDEQRSRFMPLKGLDEASAKESKCGAWVACVDDQRDIAKQKGITGQEACNGRNDDRSFDQTNGKEVDDSSGEPDDGNAWLGCVCGQVHKPVGEHKEIFWLQCEVCWSWYDSSSHCLGFTEAQAKSIASWKCWPCEDASALEIEPKTDNSATRDARILTLPTVTKMSFVENPKIGNATTESSERGASVSTSPTKMMDLVGEPKSMNSANESTHGACVSSSPTGMMTDLVGEPESTNSADEPSRGGRVSTSPTMETSDGNDLTSPSFDLISPPTNSGACFSEGDLVFVLEHAWPGVNNPEGIATVLSTCIDEDGDRVYDIKYVVGGRRKGVASDYIRPHCFEE